MTTSVPGYMLELAKGTIHPEMKHSTRSLLGGGNHAGMDAWGLRCLDYTQEK